MADITRALADRMRAAAAELRELEAMLAYDSTVTPANVHLGGALAAARYALLGAVGDWQEGQLHVYTGHDVDQLQLEDDLKRSGSV
jgi:hypothetical protein